jgi:hypothetical protein
MANTTYTKMSQMKAGYPSTPSQQVERLRSEGNYEAAGELARKHGLPRYYGCHCGMRSTLESSKAAFFRGYDKGSK